MLVRRVARDYRENLPAQTWKLAKIILFILAHLSGRWWLWGSGGMVVLVTGNGQDPAANAFTVDCFGLPRAVRLLGRGLVLRSHAFVGSTASIADEIAPNDVVARDISTAHPRAVRSSLDDLVALLLHPPVQILDQLIVSTEDAGMGHGHGLEDPKHGFGGAATVRAVVARGRVDLKPNLCVTDVIRGVGARSRRGEEGWFGRRFGLKRRYVL